MMAAFIVAIRGTVTQAVLLGLSATISHTAVVWAVAMAGLYFGRHWNAEVTESYFQVASAVLIVGVARLDDVANLAAAARGAHEHDEHDHHHDESRRIDTGHGVVRLEVFEEGVPPRFRLFRESRHGQVWDSRPGER
jgi:nickel/cobalt exporter